MKKYLLFCFLFILSFFVFFQKTLAESNQASVQLTGEVEEHITFTQDNGLFKVSTNLKSGVLFLSSDQKIKLDRFSDQNILSKEPVIICASI